MRNPKKASSLKAKSKPKAKVQDEALMQTDDGPTTAPKVWRAGIDPLEEDEELQYDPTAYDCLHKLSLDWPSLSFDIAKDDLGGPRSTFPHSLLMVAGTQAASSRQNYIAFAKLSYLGQGRHGKRAEMSESESEDDSDSDTDDDDMKVNTPTPKPGKPGSEPPPRMHYRTVQHMGGINRLRVMPQQPGVVGVWGDNGQVRIYDGSAIIKELAAEEEVSGLTTKQLQLKPLTTHSHPMEGFAIDWSSVKAGRLATGDCKRSLFVWEPQEGGTWQVSGMYSGHESSVEDIQWSPTEETVFATCSVDKTVRIWDTRERSKSMISVQAHDTDVNVISWNKHVAYMLASGGDDGTLRIWDLRTFNSGSFVSHFTFHKDAITGLEWCPYEGSMLASSSADNQLAVWDLALERDPEEEAALAAEGNAMAPEDMPAQLLFLHAGQKDLKEIHWHPQIPGMIMSTAGDGFNVFKPSNL